MDKKQPWKEQGLKKADWLAKEVAKAVNAGKEWDLETVDFSDPHRPSTCLEVDFPILPINQIATIEGSSGATRKPIYQITKWWARRNSSVFRALLIAAASKAPDDPADAAKLVWDAYYGNHQKSSFKNLKVADIFMGGGTTIVEGSRLGMEMFGNDLNPVAWFVVKNEMAKVDKDEVEALLADIEREVKPQIMPFYTSDCPRGHKGKWTNVNTSEVMSENFTTASLPPEERKNYSYEGPEIIYVFWAKHGPCQVTGCGHRTPIMSSPVIAVKELSVKYWKSTCKNCGAKYDLEEREARMAPGVPLVVSETEHSYAIANLRPNSKKGEPDTATCPNCGVIEEFGSLSKSLKKKVKLSLLIHPDWLKGESGVDSEGNQYGGSAGDSVEATIKWNQARASKCKLIEIRGELPDEVTCPATGVSVKTGKDGGTVPKRSNYSCGSCGTVQDVLTSVKASQKTGPVAMYAIQGYCPECDKENQLYGGRFFIPSGDSVNLDSALVEWNIRSYSDLKNYWPQGEIPFGFMTALNNGDIRKGHGFTHWWKMFNQRQLFVHAVLLKSISHLETSSTDVITYILGAFQQYLRNQSMFTIWNRQADQLEPQFSNSNYHPKSTMIENAVFPVYGRGNWQSCSAFLSSSLKWKSDPSELVVCKYISNTSDYLSSYLTGKSKKIATNDVPLLSVNLSCSSSTELSSLQDSSFDLVITDPPFGGLLHYSELSDFFYVWLRLALKDKYPDYFSAEYTPKSLEAVANRARQPGVDEDSKKANADIFYQRLMTECWKESYRILKPGGLLAFTFHHSEDAPWVSLLESLFDAGFYLEATYPLRSDETKGEGSKPGTFGSQKIEYDIIHVCRKRIEDPKPISWAKMRRQVLNDVRELKELLEHHTQEGLPEADLQVIRRGKALEYFSLHYGKVYKNEGEPISVLEALVGINQLIDEEMGGSKEQPPHNAEPFTRMFLRLFDGKEELARDQIQKFLRGTGSAPSDFVDRGWCYEKKKVFNLKSPLEIAQAWQGKHRRGMTSDYDQASFLIGACFTGSGINASDTLKNSNFKPHPALASLLLWHQNHGANNQIKDAAVIALSIFGAWESKHQTTEHKQLSLFFSEDD